MNAPTLLQSESSVWFRSIPALGIDMMTLLFNRLDGAYPNVFRANFKSAEAVANWRETWADAFDDEGLSPVDVKSGLKAIRRLYDMPPSLSQFLKACRPDMSSSSDPEVLFYRAVAEMTKRRANKPQDWPSCQLFWAAAAIGADLLTHDYRSMSGRWRAALDANAQRKDAIPEVSPDRALPAPKMSAADAADRLREIGATVKTMDMGTGGKLNLKWAYAIADDIASGRRVASLPAQMAADALHENNRPVPGELVPFLSARYREQAA